ncbi:hypothetical protein A3K64_03515 [Candidatus Micrarchaeota archaeon RBG_16_36_9]|nr:MAG: hypothetical protein A3K64_03515 [Candidatus Micrarchaeota archaeon RBG_16_36_9]
MADDNPPGVSQYYGISFKTGSGMIYKISNDGKLVTNLRHHLKGEDVMAITGVSQDNYAKAFDLVREVPSESSRDGLAKFLFLEGRAPALGLHLVISLTPTSVDRAHCLGVISSTIDKIE